MESAYAKYQQEMEVEEVKTVARLKEKMGAGWSGKLMARTNMSRQSVWKMVNTLNYDHQCFFHVMDLIAERKKQLAKVTKAAA